MPPLLLLLLLPAAGCAHGHGLRCAALCCAVFALLRPSRLAPPSHSRFTGTACCLMQGGASAAERRPSRQSRGIQQVCVGLDDLRQAWLTLEEHLPVCARLLGAPRCAAGPSILCCRRRLWDTQLSLLSRNCNHYAEGLVAALIISDGER